jgi:basic membrane protein A
MKTTLRLAALAAASSLVLVACAAPAAAPAAPGAAATTAPAAAPAKVFKVGLVTDVGSLSDKSFNASAWEGVQRAVKEFGVEAKAIESKQPTDYQKNIEQFANEGYDLIITVGFLMGDDTAAMAQKYPKQKFAIVDVGYFPTKGSKTCDDTKTDCYAEGVLSNINSLLFAEDQSGFLAGAAAALMSKTGTIGSVVGINIPPVCKFKVGFEKGAKYARPDIKTFGVYQQPGPKAFNDPEWGKEAALSQIKEGADVIFAAGGQTGNGGLLGIAEQAKAGKDVLGIGVDQDQYNTLEGAKSILLTSAMKRVDVSTYTSIKSVVEGKFKGGMSFYDMTNDGVGLAPFHDLDSKVSAEVKDKLAKIAEGLKKGEIKEAAVKVPDDCKE